MKIIAVVSESDYRGSYIAEISKHEIERICGSLRHRLGAGDVIEIDEAAKLGRETVGADEAIASIGRQLGALHSLLTTLPSLRDALVVKPANVDEGGTQ